METQRQIDTLESRQLELRAVMAKSDDRAAKCSKSGLDFRATYPLDYEEYEAARRAEELAAEETVMDFQNIEQ